MSPRNTIRRHIGRAVRVVKEGLVKQVLEGNGAWSLKHRLADLLLRYRSTPHSTTGTGGSVAQWLGSLGSGYPRFKTRSSHSLNLILAVPDSTS